MAHKMGWKETARQPGWKKGLEGSNYSEVSTGIPPPHCQLPVHTLG